MSNIESNNSQNGGLEDYNNISDGIFPLWHYWLWSFQGRDTKLERFLAKNQLQSNEITKFGELE